MGAWLTGFVGDLWGGRLLTFGGWCVSLWGETGMMLAETTLSDCMLIVGISVVMVLVDYVLRLAGWMRESQAASFWEWSTRHRPERKLKGVEAVGAVREFYRSPVAFLIVGLPGFAFCCGTILMFLLRDAGVTIFKWAMLINVVVVQWVWQGLAWRLMCRRMSRMVAVEGRGADAALVDE